VPNQTPTTPPFKQKNTHTHTQPPHAQHAPIALGAAGARVIVAESYARIFFRNCIATGECYPYECPGIRLCEEVQTGHEVSVFFVSGMSGRRFFCVFCTRKPEKPFSC